MFAFVGTQMVTVGIRVSDLHGGITFDSFQTLSLSLSSSNFASFLELSLTFSTFSNLLEPSRTFSDFLELSRIFWERTPGDPGSLGMASGNPGNSTKQWIEVISSKNVLKSTSAVVTSSEK